MASARVSNVVGDAALLGELPESDRKIACRSFDSIRNGFEGIHFLRRPDGYHRKCFFNEFDEPGRLSFSFLFATAPLAY